MGETLSHVDGQGLLPFERYCFASGSAFPHHLEECLCQSSAEEGTTFEMSSDAVKEQALGLLGREVMGGGETGVARNKVLGASHTHAAVGLAINATSFRMVILLVDQCEFSFCLDCVGWLLLLTRSLPLVLSLDPTSTSTSTSTCPLSTPTFICTPTLNPADLEITGCNGIKTMQGPGQSSEIRARTVHLDMKMLDEETSWGPYACVVSYRALPSSSSEDAATYEDDSGEQVAVYGPWNFSVDEEKKTYGIDVGMEAVKSGLYYFKVKVCPNASALPKAEADFEEPKESAVATGLVLRYDYDREITEENEEEIVAELQDRDAVAAEAAADAGGGAEDAEGGERVISTEEEEAERARQEEEERLEREARRREEYERKKAEQKKYQQLWVGVEGREEGREGQRATRRELFASCARIQTHPRLYHRQARRCQG